MEGVKCCFLLVAVACVVTSSSVESAPANVAETRNKRSDDPSPLQLAFDNMVHQMDALEAKVNAQQTQITAQQSRLDKYGKVVAFHTWASASAISVTAFGTVIVPHVATNIGNAYDPQTGFFTAPVSGLYMFHATFMNHDLNDYIHAGIHVGAGRVAESIADSRHGYYDNPAIAAITHVSAGQKVQLRSENNAVDNFYPGQYTTFSGFLIRAD